MNLKKLKVLKVQPFERWCNSTNLYLPLCPGPKCRDVTEGLPPREFGATSQRGLARRCRALIGTLPPLPEKQVYGKRLFSQAGERRLTREGSSPCRWGKSWVRRPMNQRWPARVMRILWRDPVTPLENVHGGRAAETRYSGLAENIVTRYRRSKCRQDHPVLSHRRSM
jgi:hypothetical protein